MTTTTAMKEICLFLFVIGVYITNPASSFCVANQQIRTLNPLSTRNSECRSGVLSLQGSAQDQLAQAQRLLEKSKALREEIARQERNQQEKQNTVPASRGLSRKNEQNIDKPFVNKSKWNVPISRSNDDEQELVVDPRKTTYRLYVDIGREPGTWMEPRWGASGRRIEFTLDVQFCRQQYASPEIAEQMVRDNQGGKSSSTFRLITAPFARLRSGFDEMKIHGEGGYRIDISKKDARQSDAVRFFINVEGTLERGSSNGDVFIPKGGLFFSIPCFGRSVTQLSNKGDMPVTVRQMGWHTGWRREESRIVGVFQAVPIEKATVRDGF